MEKSVQEVEDMIREAVADEHFMSDCDCNCDYEIDTLDRKVRDLMQWREEMTSTLKWLPQELENELTELNDLVPKMFQGLTSPLVLRIKALLLKLSRRMETSNERNDESPPTPQPSGRS